MSELTQEGLRKLLSYDRSTGLFTWNKTVNENKAHYGAVAGYKSKIGYITIRIQGKLYYAHRLVWLYMEGYIPKNIEIDHIDRNKSNNTFCNLRLASRACNSRNSKTSKKNTSGVTGVTCRKNGLKWDSYITKNYKINHIGRFETKLDAVRARWKAEVEYGFPNCNTTSSAFLYLKSKCMEGLDV